MEFPAANQSHSIKEITMAKETTLKVPALHCSSCASTVIRHVKVLGGVSDIDVDAESKLVHLTYDESKVSLDQIHGALAEIGFFAEE